MAVKYKGEWVTILADSCRGERVDIRFKDGRIVYGINKSELKRGDGSPL